MNWQLSARINALQMMCALYFAEALFHLPKEERVEGAQGVFHALRAEARRTTLYDERTPKGCLLAKDTPKEMDHIVSLLIGHLSRMAGSRSVGNSVALLAVPNGYDRTCSPISTIGSA